MKRVSVLLCSLLFPALMFAQGSKSPVMDAVRQSLAGQQKDIEAAVDEMPADKYGSRPTPDQMTFGHLVLHIAEANSLLCSRVGDVEEPKQGAEPKETDSKDKLVSTLKDSFTFCNKALASVDDSKLGGEVKIFGGRTVTKARAAIILTSSWADHYAMAAQYLRSAGLLPPSAKKK
jgi:uncharacterized damage-inducible protein DinB